MNIVGVAAQRLRWRLAPRGAARGGDWDVREAIVVAVRSDHGATGLGEAAPLPGMSTDTLADAERDIVALAARVPWVTAPREPVVAAAPAARFAIETALAVAYAQRAGTSVAGLYGAPDGRALASAAVVDDEDEARAATAPTLKIKVGRAAFADDLVRVRAIAAAAPRSVIRIDANRRWQRDRVAGYLGVLADALGDRLAYVEEPCVHAHELLAESLPCKLALDESLATLAAHDIARALASPQLGALVLKPTLLGGFGRTIELATMARAHGVLPVVTHALEGAVGRAACDELARIVGGGA